MDKEGGGEDGQRATHCVTGRDAVLLVATLKNAVRSGSQHPRVRLECRAPGKRVGMDPRLNSSGASHRPLGGGPKTGPIGRPPEGPKKGPLHTHWSHPGEVGP